MSTLITSEKSNELLKYRKAFSFFFLLIVGLALLSVAYDRITADVLVTNNPTFQTAILFCVLGVCIDIHFLVQKHTQKAKNQ